MIELNERVEIIEGYRKGELALVIWVDEENLVCKVMFDDDEIYGYDVNDLVVAYQ